MDLGGCNEWNVFRFSQAIAGPGTSSKDVVAVKPASTFATLDKRHPVPTCSRALISKAIRVSPPFGISTAYVEMSARDVFVLLLFRQPIELSKDAQG